MEESVAGINVEIAFYGQEEVSVFLESTFSGEEQERCESLLFALYAARQVANFGRADAVGASLGTALAAVDADDPTNWVATALEEVRVVASSGARGRKGFNVTFRPEPLYFKVNPYGFGMLGRGVPYYSLPSTLVLLSYLLNRNVENPDQQQRLANTANNVGLATLNGSVSVTSQVQVAEDAVDAAFVRTGSVVGGNSAQGVSAAAVDRGEWEAGDYWDVLTSVEDDSLTEDSYEFATLPDGDLIVDEKCDETLASLADAVEEELRPPYRAVAVRQGARVWSVSARPIQVEPLGLTEGDQLTLKCSGGQRWLEIDGIAVTNPEVVAVLERFASDGTDEHVVEGRRLDEGLWEVRLRPSGSVDNFDGQR
jgi:hypothetical protein